MATARVASACSGTVSFVSGRVSVVGAERAAGPAGRVAASAA